MRALVLILDGAGCGHAPDAATYGDQDADTLGHLFAAYPKLHLPALFSLGLWKILTADVFDPRSQRTVASYGRMRPRAVGKDSLSGHWEIAGVILKQELARLQSLPPELVAAIEKETKVDFLIEDSPWGAQALQNLGAEHLRTRQPLLFLGAESTLQIATHVDYFSKTRVNQICAGARRPANAWRIETVKATPFGGRPGALQYTGDAWEHRIVPPRTILNAIADSGGRVHAIGKIGRIFARSGITDSYPASSNQDTLDTLTDLWRTLDEGLIFANLPDFAPVNGHPRDFLSYAQALVNFDRWLANFLPQLEAEDLMILCADHGNDPSLPGHDHTREEVPLMILHEGHSIPLGTRRSFADIAASLADFFRLRERWPVGSSFLRPSRLRS